MTTLTTDTAVQRGCHEFQRSYGTPNSRNECRVRLAPNNYQACGLPPAAEVHRCEFPTQPPPPRTAYLHEFESFDEKCCVPVGNDLLPCGQPKDASIHQQAGELKELPPERVNTGTPPGRIWVHPWRELLYYSPIDAPDYIEYVRAGDDRSVSSEPEDAITELISLFTKDAAGRWCFNSLSQDSAKLDAIMNRLAAATSSTPQRGTED